MSPVGERSVESVGTIQTWESETGYPDETPFVSDLGWARRRGDPRFPAWLRGAVATDPTPLLTGLRMHAYGDQMGRVWLPWAFAPSASPEIAVSSLGMGAMAAGTILTISVGNLMSTSVLPAYGVLRLMNPGQIMVGTTPLWEEADEIRLFAPGLLPRTLRVRETGDVVLAIADSRVTEALEAIADIGDWLHCSQREVANLCRFSLRASRYWESGKTSSPRPSTVRHLYEVHSFLDLLVRTMGKQGARTWLAHPSETGEIRLDTLAQGYGVKKLLREASALTFAEGMEPERPLPESIAAADQESEIEPYVASPRRAPPRRARRAPRRGD